MERRRRGGTTALAGQANWHKNAIIYELHVRAFADSNDDGIGDFAGLTGKLDYLRDLGVTVLWLLPFYPSPLKDDGYDIADYTDVHRDYGTLRDFKGFLGEAHKRGLRVITELVLNHTSDQHPWFQRARYAAPGSSAREFYVWSDTPEKYREARIIFQDFESSNWAWDPAARAYYWHRFYSHQPDLNYANPAVLRAMERVLDFWLGLGVDGMRLDAVPYLAEAEGTSCENLPETHAILRHLRQHVDRRFEGRIFLAEANQWPEDAAAYFGNGDEAHMAFHFPLMPRLFMGIRQEDRFQILDILEQTPAIPDTCQWALFLRNHDELTLEMVTEEERLFMYRAFAIESSARINLGIRRRLAPLLGNHRRRIELMNALLFSLPGTPVIYYGDEIGMGDNIYLGDRNGVRTPMQWNGDRNAGFSQGNPQRLYLPLVSDPEYHAEFVHVEAQERNPHSLLWWIRKLIAIRRRHRAFGEGELEILRPANRKVLAFLRRHGDEVILVVANLSRFSQCSDLDLQSFEGWTPIEMFGGTSFSPIGPAPYSITLGPYSFYWLALKPSVSSGDPGDNSQQVPALQVRNSWDEVVRGQARDALEAILPAYLRSASWFRGRQKRILAASIQDFVPIGAGRANLYLAMVRVNYAEGEPDLCQLPVAFASGRRAQQVAEDYPSSIIARICPESSGEPGEGILYDAVWDRAVARALLGLLTRLVPIRGGSGMAWSARVASTEEISRASRAAKPSGISLQHESNSIITYGNRAVLKLFRRLDEGSNPDLEIATFLSAHGFKNGPRVMGSLEYRQPDREPVTLAVVEHFLAYDCDAWDYVLSALADFLSHARSMAVDPPVVSLSARSLLSSLGHGLPSLAMDLLGDSHSAMSLLGQRTGEMHLVLASDPGTPSFRPEPFSPLYRRSVYQANRYLVLNVLDKLRKQLGTLPGEMQEDARRVLQMEERILECLRDFLQHPFSLKRIRHHGNFHLKQVLYANGDFSIIDFEGEPTRPIAERQIKRSPLRDLASMLQSFHYAVQVGLMEQAGAARGQGEDLEKLERWGRHWQWAASVTFLESYFEVAAASEVLPVLEDGVPELLKLDMLERAVYELGYELEERPLWAWIPMRALLGDLLNQEEKGLPE